MPLTAAPCHVSSGCLYRADGKTLKLGPRNARLAREWQPARSCPREPGVHPAGSEPLAGAPGSSGRPRVCSGGLTEAPGAGCSGGGERRSQVRPWLSPVPWLWLWLRLRLLLHQNASCTRIGCSSASCGPHLQETLEAAFYRCLATGSSPPPPPQEPPDSSRGHTPAFSAIPQNRVMCRFLGGSPGPSAVILPPFYSGYTASCWLLCVPPCRSLQPWQIPLPGMITTSPRGSLR